MIVRLDLSHLKWRDRLKLCWAILLGRPFALGNMGVGADRDTSQLQ